MSVAHGPAETPGLVFTRIEIPADELDKYTITKPHGPSTGTHYATHAVHTKNSTVVSKRFNQHKDIVAKSPTGAVIPVFSISTEHAVFGFLTSSGIVPTITDPPVSTYLAPGPVPATPIAAAIAATVSEIKKKRPRLIENNSLCPFVAKQLFDLAVLRKEQCPVTMEDFSAGHTAVMPCGHLFMQFAIEESFKKEANKCPWCRQAGMPTYV